MEVESDSAAEGRLAGARMQAADSADRLKSMSYTVEDVLYGIVSGPGVEREALALVLLLLRAEESVARGVSSTCGEVRRHLLRCLARRGA